MKDSEPNTQNPTNLKIEGGPSQIEWKDKNSVKFVGAGLVLNIKGKNNKIVIGKGAWFCGFTLDVLSDDNYVYIGDKTRCAGKAVLRLSPSNRLVIDDGTSIEGANIVCCESKQVLIGKECMLSWGIDIRTTDSHPVLNAVTRERINWAKDVVIEEHVWVGQNAALLKGSVIRKNSIVANRAVVTKQFDEENVVLGGSPATIVKRGIDWDRPLLG